MAYLTGFDRKQAALFPQYIDEIIAEDAPVRLIDLFVDSLDLKQLGFVQNGKSDNGRPAYHPKDLFKLYIYGYLNRIRTSRLLERECQRNIEVIWLLHGLTPCFRTIAGFRSENPQAFRNTFTHFVRHLNKAGLIGGETIAIDSSKFRAVNSKKNNYTQDKIERHLNYIDDKVKQYLTELEENDLSDDEEEAIRNKISKQRRHKRKYKRIEKMIRENGGDQVSTTDPEARTMVLHGNVVEVAYNIQTAVDEKHKLIVEYEPTNTNDIKALLNTAVKAKEACGVKEIKVLADKGYHNGEQIESCTKHGIITYVSPPAIPRSGDIPTPYFYADNFIYNKSKDTYTCPMGHQMKTNGHWYNRHNNKSVIKVKHYKTKACQDCKVKDLCTRNQVGRVMEKSQYAETTQQNDDRVRKNLDFYRKRQEIIEHVFGTVKRQWGFDHTLLKGLEKNKGEFGIIYLVYDFRRLINILGIKGTKKWIKSLFSLNLVARRFIVASINQIKYQFKNLIPLPIVDIG